MRGAPQRSAIGPGKCERPRGTPRLSTRVRSAGQPVKPWWYLLCIVYIEGDYSSSEVPSKLGSGRSCNHLLLKITRLPFGSGSCGLPDLDKVGIVKRVTHIDKEFIIPTVLVVPSHRLAGDGPDHRVNY